MSALTYVLVACVLFGCSKSPSASRLDECSDTLRHPDRVVVHRISPQLGKRTDQNSVQGYPILSGPVEANYRFNTKEIALLLTDSTDTNWPGLRCPFNPGVTLSFFRGTNRVDVLLCFQCNEFRAFDAIGRIGGGRSNSLIQTASVPRSEVFGSGARPPLSRVDLAVPDRPRGTESVLESVLKLALPWWRERPACDFWGDPKDRKRDPRATMQFQNTLLRKGCAYRASRFFRYRGSCGRLQWFVRRRREIAHPTTLFGARRTRPNESTHFRRADDIRRTSCRARRAFAITSSAGIGVAFPSRISFTRRRISASQALATSGSVKSSTLSRMRSASCTREDGERVSTFFSRVSNVAAMAAGRLTDSQ